MAEPEEGPSNLKLLADLAQDRDLVRRAFGTNNEPQESPRSVAEFRSERALPGSEKFRTISLR